MNSIMIFDVEIEYLIAILGILILGLFAAAVFISIFRLAAERQKRYIHPLNLAFFKIEKSFFENQQFSENFYVFLRGFLKDDWLRNFFCGRPFFVFEMAAAGDDIDFYFGCPKAGKDLVLNEFSKSFPDFKITEIPAPNYFSPGEKAKGFELYLNKHFVLPILTYLAPNEFLPPVIKVFRESRGKMAMQVLIRPASYSLKAIFKKQKRAFLKFDLNSLKFLKQKAQKPAFELNIRFLSPAKDLMASEINLIALKKLFEDTRDKNYNSLKAKEPENQNEFIFNFVFRIFESYKDVILNSEELATVFYL